MMPTLSPRTTRTILGTMLIGALALTGCSASPDLDAAEQPVAATPEAGAFPTTIEHALGKTEITEAPKRVATVGWATSDIVVALGTVPVAMGFSDYGADKDGFFPWFREAADALGGPLPEALPSLERGEIDFEALAATDPDLILATYSGIDENDYKRLSEIAPTVGYPEMAWSTPLEDNLDLVSRALGRTERAAELTADMDKKIETAAAEHPEFNGVSVAQGSLPWDDGNMVLYTVNDSRIQLLQRLGFTPSEDVEKLLNADGGSSSVSLGLETLTTIGADLYITNAEDDKGWDTALANPVFARWEPVAAGKVFVSRNMPEVMALAAPSPISIPWALESYVSGIAAALAGTTP